MLDNINEILYAFTTSSYVRRNFALFLRLLATTQRYQDFVEAVDEWITVHELPLEQAAELWCALADKGVPVANYPAQLLDRAHALRWPEREEPLAHRPGLLHRLSALEDGELL